MAMLSRRLRARTADLSLTGNALAEQAAMPEISQVPGMATHSEMARDLLLLDKIFMLKDVELFAQSADATLEKLAMLLEEINLAACDELFQQGDAGHSLYIVINGQVRVHIGEQILGYMGQGKVFGEMALLESAPRLATVTAVVPSQLLRLHREPFFELLETVPDLMRNIITILSGRLRQRLELLASPSTGV